jgi:hypothetical protein
MIVNDKIEDIINNIPINFINKLGLEIVSITVTNALSEAHRGNTKINPAETSKAKIKNKV